MRKKLLIAAGLAMLIATTAVVANPNKPEQAGKGAAQKAWAQERREELDREERRRLEEVERERRGPPGAS